jgi:hypothetical protein
MIDLVTNIRENTAEDITTFNEIMEILFGELKIVVGVFDESSVAFRRKLETPPTFTLKNRGLFDKRRPECVFFWPTISGEGAKSIIDLSSNTLLPLEGHDTPIYWNT